MIGAGFVLLVVQYWGEIVSGYISEGDMTAQMLAVFCSASGVFASTGALVYIVRQTYFQDPIKLAFVISRRSLAILHSGGQRVFLHSDSLQYFNRLSGQLYFRDGAKLIVAPYRFGSPYNGMLRLLLTSWRPERGTLPEHIYGTGSNRLLGVLLGWLCTCSLLSSSMVLSCGILLIYMLDFMTKLSERIDVSLPTPGSSTNPVVSDFHTPG
ncbi:MAG: hypothetical protein JNK74_03370 [Candidatus Hydrogenedentes bacterium]|nr:hypothetical protein [Candidatus Hydrogenedentota bacterium]